MKWPEKYTFDFGTSLAGYKNGDPPFCKGTFGIINSLEQVVVWQESS